MFLSKNNILKNYTKYEKSIIKKEKKIEVKYLKII